MSNGGQTFHAMHTAHRYRDIPCGACGIEFMAYGQRKICDACKAAKSKTPEAVQKLSAQRAVKVAVQTGKLVRQPCVVCAGKRQVGKSHGHHEDYAKPLEVIWLCSWHHIERHREIKAGTPLSESRWLSPSKGQ